MKAGMGSMSLYSPQAKMASKAKQLQVEFIQTQFQTYWVPFKTVIIFGSLMVFPIH